MRDERILEGTQKHILSGTQESLVWLQVPQAINSLEQVIRSAGFKGLDKSFPPAELFDLQAPGRELGEGVVRMLRTRDAVALRSLIAVQLREAL